MAQKRKNIKVPKGLFEMLNEQRPDGMTWPEYIERECIEEGEVHGLPPVAELRAELQAVREAVETVEARTGKIDRTLEALEGGPGR